MSMSNTEVFGFANQFLQLLQDNQAALLEKGLDVSSWIVEISGQKDDAVAKDAEEDDLRATLKVKSTATKTSVSLVYKTSSTKLDAVVGVLGKETPLAKQAARLRSNIIKQTKRRNDTGNQTTG